VTKAPNDAENKAQDRSVASLKRSRPLSKRPQRKVTSSALTTFTLRKCCTMKEWLVSGSCTAALDDEANNK